MKTAVYVVLGLLLAPIAAHAQTADPLLTAVESPMARAVEIHRSMTTDGMASMRRDPRLVLEPGKPVTLASGGYHLMFIGLTKALKPGAALPATLIFASGVRIPVAFEVSTGQPPAGGHHMPGM